jgi:hypothetical protein
MSTIFSKVSTLAVVFAATTLPALAQPAWWANFQNPGGSSGFVPSNGGGAGAAHTGFTWLTWVRRGLGNAPHGGNSGPGVGTQNRPDVTPVAVPEIDASTGLLALAAVLAALALAWEVRRRRARA